jgi:cathepsin A (carboxypeptidase C)
MIFLDEPVQTGFSYSDAGFPSTPMSAAAAAEDAYAFLQVFFARFPELGRMPFHLAGESWGGQFVPHLAATVHRRNLAIAIQKQKQKQDQHDDPHIRNQHANEVNVKINLRSILMGNAMTDGLRQFPTLARYLCKGPYALFDFLSKECEDLDRTAERCEKMVRACYKYDNSIICGPAEQVCWKMINPVFGEPIFLEFTVFDLPFSLFLVSVFRLSVWV